MVTTAVEQFVIDQASKHGITAQKWGEDTFRVQIWDEATDSPAFNGIIGLEALAQMVARAEEEK